MRALAVIALALAGCAAVNPAPEITRHIEPRCVAEPYVISEVTLSKAHDLDAGPYVTDTGVRLPAERFDDFTAGEAPQP